jgi:ectoine hydroxylase-related dioxygenase (phytanoyl-CoA dioxygenase family)
VVGAGNTWDKQIEDAGFALIPEVLPQRELTSLLCALDGLVHRRGRAGIRHILNQPRVKAIANDARMLGLAQGVLGENAFPFRATLFDKWPDSNWLIAWHQDTALPLVEERETPGWGPWSVKEGIIYAHAPSSALEQILALRLHLDDSTQENGPLRVLPGTHKTGVLSDDEVERTAARGTPQECLVACGGVLAMRPLLIHASSKARSPMPRRVLHIEYAACPAMGEGLHLATV